MWVCFTLSRWIRLTFKQVILLYFKQVISPYFKQVGLRAGIGFPPLVTCTWRRHKYGAILYVFDTIMQATLLTKQSQEVPHHATVAGKVRGKTTAKNRALSLPLNNTKRRVRSRKPGSVWQGFHVTGEESWMLLLPSTCYTAFSHLITDTLHILPPASFVLFAYTRFPLVIQ